MQHDQLFQARQNRLISIVRAVLAAFALAAVLVDTQRLGGPAGRSVDWILSGYFVISLIIVAAARIRKDGQAGQFMPAFVLDIAVFLSVLLLTGGSTNPFVPLLLLSGALQWGWRGAAAITVLVLAAFAPNALAVFERFHGAAPDPQRFIIRVGNVIALGGMMVALVRYQERVSRDLQRLSGAPLQTEASEQPPILACLAHAADVFGLTRAVFVWGDPEEPGLTLSEITPTGGREGPWPLKSGELPPELDSVSQPFLFDPAGTETFSLGADGRMTPAPREAAQSPVLARLASTRALVLPVQASWFSGWMILPDFPQLDRESLVLGGAVAAQAAVSIEAWRSLMVWRDAASAEERVRMARDLHDGTLQFLAGAAMQLEAVGRELSPGQEAVREHIRRLQEDLRTEQRQLRELINTTSALADSSRRPTDFQAQAQNLVAVLARRWSAEISVDIDPADRNLPGNLVFELLQLVREAISNAVRHGHASVIAIRTAREGHALELTIEDNGEGMPIHGVFSMAELKARSVGPRTLRGRVASLGGDLTIETGPQGTTLKIKTPLAVMGAAT